MLMGSFGFLLVDQVLKFCFQDNLIFIASLLNASYSHMLNVFQFIVAEYHGLRFYFSRVALINASVLFVV